MDVAASSASSITRSRRKKVSFTMNIFKHNLLIIMLVIGVALGVILGTTLRDVLTFQQYREIYYLEFPGRLLMNMLKSMVIPLIMSSLITGMANMGTHSSGKLGAAAVIYYLATTFIAVFTGIFLVLAIHPGRNIDIATIRREGTINRVSSVESILDLINQCFPENYVSACFERVVTEIVHVKSLPIRSTTFTNVTYTVDVEKPKLVAHSGTNVLGLVVLSIAVGVVINIIGDEGEAMRSFFNSLNSVTLLLVTAIIWYTPIGIIFLIASKFISTRDIMEAARGLAWYMVVVLTGLTVHGFFTLPLIFVVLTRKNPAVFAFNMLKALFTAWGTSSSSATLPITMDCLIRKNKLDINIVRFVAPVGATVNMDGTALYEAVACIFIAQVNGIDLGFAGVIIISFTATAAAIGAAGIPQAGLVTMVIVLTAVGLPTEDITLIVSVDWFLDRFRTVVNVWGDCVGAGIMDHFFRDMFAEGSPDLSPGEVRQAKGAGLWYIYFSDPAGWPRYHGDCADGCRFTDGRHYSHRVCRLVSPIVHDCALEECMLDEEINEATEVLNKNIVEHHDSPRSSQPGSTQI